MMLLDRDAQIVIRPRVRIRGTATVWWLPSPVALRDNTRDPARDFPR